MPRTEQDLGGCGLTVEHLPNLTIAMKLYHIVMIMQCGQYPLDGDIRLISANVVLCGILLKTKKKENKKTMTSNGI